MATELDRNAIPGWIAESGRSGLVRLRANLAHGRKLLARRPDLRFRLLPWDVFDVANGAVLLVSLLLVLAFAVDPLFVSWQERLPAGIVALFGAVTRLGKSDWILLSTGLFLILMLCLDATDLRVRHRARRTARSLAAFYVFASVACSGIVANLAKYVIGRGRPKHFLESGSYSFDWFSGDASWASFPSGHATTAMALGLSLALLFPRLRWVFLTFGFWIAVSRLFTGVHYPSDVLAGGLLGASTAWLFARALARRRLVFGFTDGGGLVRRKGASGRLL